MIPYLVLLLMVTTIADVGRRLGGRIARSVSLVLVCTVLIGFGGLRDRSVGTDTGTYVVIFSQLDSLQSALSKEMEVGYNVVSWLAKMFSESYASLLLMISALTVPLYLSTIVRLAKRYEIGIYLFVVLGFYTFAFNGARQAIATAICFWAIRFILDRRLWPYLAAVGFAMLFHKTALVSLPLYFLATPKLRLSRLTGLLLAIIFLTTFLGFFVGLSAEVLDDRFLVYADMTEGGGIVMGTFLLVQGALLFWMRRFIRTDFEVYVRLLNIYLAGLVPVAISMISNINPSGLQRLNIYFSVVAVLLWPIVFRSISGTRLSALLGFTFLVVTLAFYVMTTTTFSHLVPYQLNSELFK
jgi:hypothetical protein